jgi:hypothetical protein
MDRSISDTQETHLRSVWSIFKQEPEVLQYQLVQLSQTVFELKLVTQDEASFHRLLPRITKRLRDTLGTETTVEVKYFSRLGREESGKFRPVKSILVDNS